MVGVIVVAFAFQMFYAEPEADRILSGLFTPGFAGTESVLLAAGILGTTVMPHVIYLHSALTQRRTLRPSSSGSPCSPPGCRALLWEP